MPKVICKMHNGHSLTLRSGIKIPGKAEEIECTDFQLQCIKADCRVVVYTKKELKAMQDAEVKREADLAERMKGKAEATARKDAEDEQKRDEDLKKVADKRAETDKAAKQLAAKRLAIDKSNQDAEAKR